MFVPSARTVMNTHRWVTRTARLHGGALHVEEHAIDFGLKCERWVQKGEVFV